jgi:hypothetical protein
MQGTFQDEKYFIGWVEVFIGHIPSSKLKFLVLGALMPQVCFIFTEI